MARKIEQLLRIAADMRKFETGDQSAHEKILSLESLELPEEELDRISAASVQNADHPQNEKTPKK